MIKSSSSTLSFQQGSVVYFGANEFQVIQIIDLTYVLCENIKTKEICRLRIDDLNAEPTKEMTPSAVAIDALPDKDWQLAQARLEIIRPLVHQDGRTKDDVDSVAESHGLHRNTIYKWLRLYESQGLLSSLAPKTRSDSGSKKLSQESEAIVSACIEDEYLSKQRKSIANLYIEIKRQCRNAGICAPHVNTVRNRVNLLSSDLKIRKRFGAKKSHESLHMNQG
ncbi:helix-turn-helix domain-containing protein, partial [Vibrio anguillarum]